MKTRSLSMFYFILIPILFSACHDAENHQEMVDQLMDVDREFAKLSVERGSHASFLAYIDDSCILLRPNRYPVIGRKKIEEMFNTPDTSFTLNWEPLSGDISESDDIGYTYGIYTIQMDSPEGIQVKKEGTYVTIWKRDKDGKWKFVLDTGNQGLGAKNGETE